MALEGFKGLEGLERFKGLEGWQRADLDAQNEAIDVWPWGACWLGCLLHARVAIRIDWGACCLQEWP